MKDRNTSWVKYAVFLTFWALILSALVFWLCAYLDSPSGKAPSDPIPPIEDSSELPDEPNRPDGSKVPDIPNKPNDPDGSDIINGSEDTDPIPNPQESYEQIKEEFSKWLYTYVSDRAEYPLADCANLVSVGDTTNTITEVLGTPHFYYLPQIYTETSLLPRSVLYIYVMDDGTVLECAYDSYFFPLKSTSKAISIVTYDVETYVKHIQSEWSSIFRAQPSDPQTTQELIHSSLIRYKYMHISDRTDYPDFMAAKTISYGISISSVESILGEPHYTQIEEEKHAPNSPVKLETRFYVLSNGTVLMVGCISTQNPIATEIMFFNADRILNAIETYLAFKLEDDQISIWEKIQNE